MSKLQHFSHPHTLSLGEGGGWWYGECKMCHGSIRREHSVYYCRNCSPWLWYFIHKSCGELPQHINPSIHSPHQFTLVSTRSLSNSNPCYYCDKPFETQHRLCYTCDHCSINMHDTCALIPLPSIASSSDHHQHVQFLCHQNPMILTHSPHDNHRQCLSCQSPWSSGSAYTCTTCHSFFHKSCAELPQKIQHPFHPHHFLALQLKPTSCSFCCKRNFYSFCCENECNFNLGIECAFLTPTMINYRRHDHPLSFIQKSYYNIEECDSCHYSYIKRLQTVVPEEISRTQSFFFHCMECDFKFHFLCGPLPSKIKHECHVDSLTLIDSINKDDSNEYYCDVCEGELDSRIRVYRCADCKYVAHVHCVASEIAKVFKEESRDVELMAAGDHRWKRGDTLLVSKDLDGQEKDLTLRDLIDGLAQEEKDLLQTPDAPEPYSYEYYREMNSRFDRFNTSIEDIERVQEFFHFNPWKFIWELRYFKLSEGLLKLLDEKHLGLKLVHVKDYMVPQTLAPILKTLLLEHRYFGGDQSLSQEMKSIACSLLCVVIEKMCRTKVEVLAKQILREWHFYLRAILNITGFRITKKFLDRLENEVVPAFIGLEVDRFENDIFNRLDHKIATLEAELEKYKGIRRTHTKFDRSQASEDMTWSMRIASKLKGEDVGDVLLSESTFAFRYIGKYSPYSDFE